jgi:ribosomal protein S27E
LSGSMPRRVQEEARRYLECGQLRFGFLEVRCEECRRLELVAFSCKGRGWCPSCTTRRSIETGAHVEATLPVVAHRQWTLSVPRAWTQRFKVGPIEALWRGLSRGDFSLGAAAVGMKRP